jgi:hypothetical protein
VAHHCQLDCISTDLSIKFGDKQSLAGAGHGAPQPQRIMQWTVLNVQEHIFLSNKNDSVVTSEDQLYKNCPAGPINQQASIQLISD